MEVQMNKLCANNISQMVEALTCPVNRYATMVEHSCDEYELFKHPDWLVEHYVKFGGATKNAQLRKERDENKTSLTS
jgi:hypothetical protein